MHRFAILAVVTLLACGDASGPASVDHPREIQLSAQQLEAHLSVLAADGMCGRAAGTIYERRSAEYIRDQFTAAGLAPGAEGYFQSFPIGLLGPPEGPANEFCDTTTVPFSQNVIGILPGTGHLAGQWVVLGAHYDHLGWIANGEAVLVFNGADDNGSGTVVVLEVARLLSDYLDDHASDEARRSIMFHAYGAEEIGLEGSRHYVGNPTVPMDSIVGMVNLDMVGRLRENLLTINGASTSAAWQPLLEDTNQDGLSFVFQDQFLDRSDHFGFIQHGVPIVHFFTGMHLQYHTPSDDIDDINVSGLRAVGRLVLTLLWEVAVRPDRP